MEMIQVDDKDVIVSTVDLKDTKVTEVVTKNDDGTYSIYLNARFSNERLKQAFDHAVQHLKNDDFYAEDVQAIEARAHHENPTLEMTDDEIQKALLNDALERRRRKIRQRREQIQARLAEYAEFADQMDKQRPFLYSSRLK